MWQSGHNDPLTGRLHANRPVRAYARAPELKEVAGAAAPATLLVCRSPVRRSPTTFETAARSVSTFPMSSHVLRIIAAYRWSKFSPALKDFLGLSRNIW